MKFTEWTSLPEGFIEAEARDLAQFSANPILLHLQGRRQRPLFLSVLLHGNEDTGWRALQMVLRRYEGNVLPRSLCVLIGNVQAAEKGVRRLDQQPDYNRIWPGTPLTGTAEAEMMQRIVRRMQFLNPFAFIDIHNNTGKNPYYACVTDMLPHNLYLASLFSRIAVYFKSPVGTAAGAMSQLCPSITVECGKAGERAGDERAAGLIDAAMHLDHFPEVDHTAADLQVYHTVATVRIASGCEFSFGEPPAPIVFPSDFDHWNFRELEAGTEFARVGPGDARLEVTDEVGMNGFDDFMERAGDALRLRRRVMPAMITLDKQVIRQDCLCYLMEQYDPRHR